MSGGGAETHVEGHGCLLAVKDHGGGGEPLLLLHGAGASLLAWSALAPALTSRHRVLTLDLRGHGHSEAAPWSWETAVADIEAVLAEFGAEGAALIGHSLGGMLAARYALDHPETAAVVNIDGHDGADPALYPGLDPGWVRERLAELRRLQEAQAGRRFSAEEMGAVMAATAAQARAEGRPAAEAEQALRRCLASLPDGAFALRPERHTTIELLDAVAELDLFALYPRLRCPLLVVCAMQAPASPPEMPWLGDLHRSHLAAVTERLSDLASERRDMHVGLIPCTHARILLEPGLPARIEAFLGSGD